MELARGLVGKNDKLEFDLPQDTQPQLSSRLLVTRILSSENYAMLEIQIWNSSEHIDHQQIEAGKSFRRQSKE
jgi:hypothetical protein